MILGSMRWFKESLEGLDAGEVPRRMTIVDYPDYLRRDRGFGHSASALVIARQEFEDVNGWLVGFFPAEDFDLALRLGVAGRTIQILAPPTVWHRTHQSNTINNVALFIPVMEILLQRERQGCYPGGRGRRFDRHALLGGMTFFWLRRMVNSGPRWKALKLLGKSWPMVFRGMGRRLKIILSRQRRPCETIEI
jgi:hypothetical protein